MPINPTTNLQMPMEIGKPHPEYFDDYEDFIESLVAWKVNQLLSGQPSQPPVNPNMNDFETLEKYHGALVDWAVNLRCFYPSLSRRSNTVLLKFISTHNPNYLIKFRDLLDDWIKAGIRPVAFRLPSRGGHNAIWLFDRVGDGISADQDDGTDCWLWSEKDGIKFWSYETTPTPLVPQ